MARSSLYTTVSENCVQLESVEIWWRSSIVNWTKYDGRVAHVIR